MMALAGVPVRLSSAAVGCCWALAAVPAKAAHAMSSNINVCFMGPPGFASLRLGATLHSLVTFRPWPSTPRFASAGRTNASAPTQNFCPQSLGPTSLRLEAEHVAGFHEELAAVVEETVAGVGHVSGETSGGAYYVEIL